jgi:hypothetical protein
MKTYGKWRYSSTIRNLHTSWIYLVAFHPAASPPGKQPIVSNIGGWVEPTASLESLALQGIEP